MPAGLRVVQHHLAVHDGPAGLAGGQTLGEGVRAQPYQRIGRGDVQLRDDHAGRLVDLDPLQRLQLLPAVPAAARGVPVDVRRHQVQQRQRRQFRRPQAPVEAVIGQWSGLVAEQVQRPDRLAGDGHRQRDTACTPESDTARVNAGQRR